MIFFSLQNVLLMLDIAMDHARLRQSYVTQKSNL